MDKTIRRILVAVDLSESRDAAFERALLLARNWNAALYLLHARQPRPVSRFAISGEDLELESNDAEQSHLKALLRSAKNEGVQVQAIDAEGDPAPALAAYAGLVEADLIVIGRDFGSSRLWRSPRVAATVGRSAPVPVLIVPSRKAAPPDLVRRFKKVVV